MSRTAFTAFSSLALLRRSLSGLLVWLPLFPIFWMTLIAFKPQQQAYSSTLCLTPALDSCREARGCSDDLALASHSALILSGATLLWMRATRRMPLVSVPVPVLLRGGLSPKQRVRGLTFGAVK